MTSQIIDAARRLDHDGIRPAGGRLHRQGPVRQKGGAGEAEATGANPTDRAKPGTKRHALTEAQGLPVAVLVTGANRHDMKMLAELLDATVIEPAPAAPPHLVLDRGYDYPDCRDAATARGYTAHIPPQASAERPLPPPGHPDRHPPRRWVVEVTHAWFNRFRRLQPLPAAADPLGEARRPLPRFRPIGRCPHHLPQGPPCATTFRIGCKLDFSHLNGRW